MWRWLAFAALFVALIVPVALWLEHRSDVILPAPTGSYAVGRTLFDWADGQRELLVWTWYPAVRQPGAAFDSYIPASLRRPPGPRNIFTRLTTDASRVRGHSLANAPFSPAQRSWPVVFIGAGGSGEIVNYSTLAEDLASHGYVVVGFDTAGRTGLVVFPDGRAVAQLPGKNPELLSERERVQVATGLVTESVANTGFVLDKLQQSPIGARLDLSRVGIFGHSFGGAAALEFCRVNPRCKAGIDIDGRPLGDVIQTGIQKPFMFLLSDHSGESGPEARQIMADIHSVYDRLPLDQRAMVVITGANHFTFSDDGALRKSGVFRLILRAFGKLRISGRQQLAMTTEHVHTFFDKHLK